MADFIFGDSKITADGDCSYEIKRGLLLGRKVMTNLDSIVKSRDISLPTKVHLGEGNGNSLQYSCLETHMDGELNMTERLHFHFHALGKAMATHSSVLAWRIPGTGAWWAAVCGVVQSWA